MENLTQQEVQVLELLKSNNYPVTRTFIGINALGKNAKSASTYSTPIIASLLEKQLITEISVNDKKLYRANVLPEIVETEIEQIENQEILPEIDETENEQQNFEDFKKEVMKETKIENVETKSLELYGIKNVKVKLAKKEDLPALEDVIEYIECNMFSIIKDNYKRFNYCSFEFCTQSRLDRQSIIEMLTKKFGITQKQAKSSIIVEFAKTVLFEYSTGKKRPVRQTDQILEIGTKVSYTCHIEKITKTGKISKIDMENHYFVRSLTITQDDDKKIVKNDDNITIL